MNKEERERLYIQLNTILELVESRGLSRAKQELEELIQKVIYNKL